MGKYKNFEDFDIYLDYLKDRILLSNILNKELHIIYLESLRLRNRDKELHTNLRIFHGSLCRVDNLEADDYYMFLLKMERDSKT